jgi:ribose transport system permease protein
MTREAASTPKRWKLAAGKESLLGLLVRLRRALRGRQEIFVLALLLGLGAFLSLYTQAFLSPGNLANIARGFSWIAVVAFGQSLVMIIDGIDLSVGAVMALSGLVAAASMQAGWPAALALFMGLLAGALVGWTNGMLVGRTRLPPFVVTLGTMSMVRGLMVGVTGGWPARDLPPSFLFLGQGDMALGAWRLPIPVLIMLALAGSVELSLRGTLLGRYIYALGSSERALQFSGIDTSRLKILVYTLCGALAAAGGLLMTARLGVAAPTAAVGYELEIIAAAVFGGTSLYGGEGSILGVLIGAAFLQVLRSGLVLLGFPAYWQSAAVGAAILFALLSDYIRRQRRLH